MAQQRKSKAEEIIRILIRDNFYAECLSCGESIRLKDAHLFEMDNFGPEAEKLYEERIAELRERAKEIREKRRQISMRSELGAKAINIGFILERLTPAMKTFRFNTDDCRSLFDPIDYIIFEGLSEKGKVDRLIFTDIKTGGARLNNHQKAIKTVVDKKRLTLDIYSQEVVK